MSSPTAAHPTQDRNDGNDGRPQTAPPADPAVPAALAGLTDYRIDRLLGQGGMGAVYLAQNLLMDRPEVLKVVNAAFLQRPAALKRFQEEIRSAARLQHPNIVTAYSCLRPGDLLVFAMEYVDGKDLAQAVKEAGPMPVANACYYAQQAARGLQHAHEKKMVHRDVKPANLILARDGKRHAVKILDFGLAKMVWDQSGPAGPAGDGPADTGLTGAGKMLGTPDYIAPEQIVDAARADVRADIYSLGCTLYFLLTGRPPFKAASLTALLDAHMKLEAAPLNLVRPEVPIELAGVVAKMMAKDPARRFQTPLEAAQALQPFLKPGAKEVVPTAEPVGGAPTAEGPARAGETHVVAAPPAVPVPPAAPAPPTLAPSAAPTAWADLGELTDQLAPPPTSARTPRARARQGRSRGWLVGGIAGGLLLVGLAIAAAAGAFRAKAKDEPVAPEGPAVATVTSKVESKKGAKGAATTPTTARTAPPAASAGPKGGVTVPPAPPAKSAPPDPPPPKVTPPAPVVAWADLFNGKDTDGWATPDANGGTWAATDGELRGTWGDRASLPAVLLTKKADHRHFHLRFEAMADAAGDQRLLLRGSAVKGRVSGYVIQLDGRGSAGAFARFNADPAGAPPAWQEPAATGRPEAGKWHSWEVFAAGPRVVVRVDGRPAADWALPSDPHPAGAIGLVAVGRAPGRYRNLQVREFPTPDRVLAAAGMVGNNGRSAAIDRPTPFGGRFWDRWALSGRTVWDVDADGRLVLSGRGALLGAGAEFELAASADAEAWVGARIATDGKYWDGIGARVVGGGGKVQVGTVSAKLTGDQWEGTAQTFKPGEFFKVGASIGSRLEPDPDSLTGRSIIVERLTATVNGKPTAVVVIKDKTAFPAGTSTSGLVLRQGTVTLKP